MKRLAVCRDLRTAPASSPDKKHRAAGSYAGFRRLLPDFIIIKNTEGKSGRGRLSLSFLTSNPSFRENSVVNTALLTFRDRNNAGYIPLVVIQYPAKAKSSRTIAAAQRRQTLLE